MPKGKTKQARKLRPLPAAEASWTVDPLSDLVSASELRIWRNHPTSRKILRYLERWRTQLLEQLGEGVSLEADVGASAMRTTEFVAKNQLLRDILALEAKDLAQFYGLAEPKEPEEKKR